MLQQVAIECLCICLRGLCWPHDLPVVRNSSSLYYSHQPSPSLPAVSCEAVAGAGVRSHISPRPEHRQKRCAHARQTRSSHGPRPKDEKRVSLFHAAVTNPPAGTRSNIEDKGRGPLPPPLFAASRNLSAPSTHGL